MGVPIIGKVVRVLPQCAFMESMPGVPDVYIPTSTMENHGARLKVGEILVVEADERIIGENKWRVSKIVDCLRGESTCDAEKPKSSQREARVKTDTRQAQSKQLSAQLKQAPVDECAVRTASILNCVMQMIKDDRGGILAAQLVSKLYAAMPEAKEELSAAGGLKAFCRMHGGQIRFVDSEVGGRVELARSGTGEDGGRGSREESEAASHPMNSIIKTEVCGNTFQGRLGAGGEGVDRAPARQSNALSEAHGTGMKTAESLQQGAMLGGSKQAASRVKTVTSETEVKAADEGAIGTSAESVMRCLLMLLEKGGGEASPGPLMNALRQMDAGAKAVVSAVGGLKGFCAQHSDVVEFVHEGGPNGGQGLVRLRRKRRAEAKRIAAGSGSGVGGPSRGENEHGIASALGETAAPHAKCVVDGDQGSGRVLIVGKIALMLPQHCAFIESSPGVRDVMATHDVLDRYGSRLCEGDVVTVEAVPLPDQSIWRVVQIIADSKSEAGQQGRGHGGATQPVRGDGDGQKGTRENGLRARTSPPVMASLPPIAPNHDRSASPQDKGGKAAEARSTSAAIVLQCVVRMLREGGGEGGVLAAQLVSELYAAMPEAKEELSAAGGLKGFCRVHAAQIRFVDSEVGGRVELARSGTGEDGGRGSREESEAASHPMNSIIKTEVCGNTIQGRLGAGGEGVDRAPARQSNALSEAHGTGMKTAESLQQGAMLGGSKQAASRVKTVTSETEVKAADEGAIGTSAESVMRCLLMLLEKGGGEASPGPLMNALRQMDAGAKAVVSAVGGLKGFCAQHSDVVEFVHEGGPNGGQGLVRLRRKRRAEAKRIAAGSGSGVGGPSRGENEHGIASASGETAASRAAGNEQQAGLTIQSNVSLGSSSRKADSSGAETDEVELEGKLTIVNAMYALMESAPGVTDVYVRRSVLDRHGRVSVGDVLRVRATKKEQGRNSFDVVEVLGREEGGCAVDGDRGRGMMLIVGKLTRLLPHCAFMESSPGVCDVYAARDVIDKYGSRLREGDVITVEAEAAMRGQNRWRAVKIIADSKSKARSTPAAIVLQCVVRLLREGGGEGGVLAAQLVSELYAAMPEAKEELKAAGGLKGFCRVHAAQIRFVDSEVGGRVELARSGTEDAGGEQTAPVSQTGKPQAAGYGKGVEGAVLECLTQLLLKEGGEASSGGLMKVLYEQEAGAQAVVKAAGGVKGYCAKHSRVLEFVHDGSTSGGQGLVRLRTRGSLMPRAGAQLAGSEELGGSEGIEPTAEIELEGQLAPPDESERDPKTLSRSQQSEAKQASDDNAGSVDDAYMSSGDYAADG